MSKVDGNEYSYSVSGVEKIKRSVWNVPFGTGEIASDDVVNEFLSKAKLKFPELIGSNHKRGRLLERLFQDD